MASTAAQLPPIVRKLLREPTVGSNDAFALLGLEANSDLGYRMLVRYRTRTMKLVNSGRPLDVDSVLPRRNNAGDWAEIPNTKVGGKIRCRSDLLLWMLYPEGVSHSGRGAA